MRSVLLVALATAITVAGAYGLTASRNIVRILLFFELFFSGLLGLAVFSLGGCIEEAAVFLLAVDVTVVGLAIALVLHLRRSLQVERVDELSGLRG